MVIIENLDHFLFEILTVREPIPHLDQFFILITSLNKNKPFAITFLVAIFAISYWKFQKKGIFIALGIGLWVGLGDVIGGQILKPSFERLRPFELFNFIPKYSAGGFSFPSNHSLNMFCVAVLCAPILKSYSWILFLYASLVAYSRIYLGVHFPFDVLGGAIVGASWGALGVFAWKSILKLREKKV